MQKYFTIQENDAGTDAYSDAYVHTLENIIKECADHLDGCSHGYSDDLWDAVSKIILAL